MNVRVTRLLKLYRFTLALCGIGFGLWFASMWHGFGEMWCSRLEHAALCILGTTVVTVFFHREVREHFSILLSAKQAGVTDVYPYRSDEVIKRMNDSAAAAGECIQLLAIAGTDFLQRKSPFLLNLESRQRKGVNVKVEILLLDPRSRFAVERALREEGYELQIVPDQFVYADSTLCEDTLNSVHGLERLIKYREEQKRAALPVFSIEVRLYNFPPFHLSLRADDRVYVENYHAGMPKGESENPYAKCLGKAVPVEEVTLWSDYGQINRSHFDFLWTHALTQRVGVGTYAQIQESLRSTDWLAFHKSQIFAEGRLFRISQQETSDQINSQPIGDRSKTRQPAPCDPHQREETEFLADPII